MSELLRTLSERVILDKERVYKSFSEWKRTILSMFPHMEIEGDVYHAKADGIALWNGTVGIIYDKERNIPPRSQETHDDQSNHETEDEYDADEWSNSFEGVNMDLIKDIENDLFEGKDEDGNRTFKTHKAWKAAVKKHKPDAEFYGDKDIGGAHGVGEWDGESGYITPKKEEVKEEVAEKSTCSLKAHIAKVLAPKPVSVELPKVNTPVEEAMIAELSKTKLASYITKATDDVNDRAFYIGREFENKAAKKSIEKTEKKIDKRKKNIEKVVGKLANRKPVNTSDNHLLKRQAD